MIAARGPNNTHPLAEPKVRCSAVWLLVLAVPVGLAGNPFLALCGIITGGLVLLARSGGIESSSAAEPVAALSIVTVALAIFYAAVVGSSGLYTVIMSDNPHFIHRACKVSSDWLSRYNSTLPSADSELAFSADEGLAAPPPAPLSVSLAATPPAAAPPPHPLSAEAFRSLAVLERLQDVLCGAGAPQALLVMGFTILAFALLIALPFAMNALALGSAARQLAETRACASRTSVPGGSRGAARSHCSRSTDSAPQKRLHTLFPPAGAARRRLRVLHAGVAPPAGHPDPQPLGQPQRLRQRRAGRPGRRREARGRRGHVLTASGRLACRGGGGGCGARRVAKPLSCSAITGASERASRARKRLRGLKKKGTW